MRKINELVIRVARVYPNSSINDGPTVSGTYSISFTFNEITFFLFENMLKSYNLALKLIVFKIFLQNNFKIVKYRDRVRHQLWMNSGNRGYPNTFPRK